MFFCLVFVVPLCAPVSVYLVVACSGLGGGGAAGLLTLVCGV